MPDMSRYLRSCRPIRERMPDFVSDRVIFSTFSQWLLRCVRNLRTIQANNLKPYQEKLQAAFPDWNVTLSWMPAYYDGLTPFVRIQVYLEHKTRSAKVRANHGFASNIPVDFVTDPAFPLEDYVRRDLHHVIDKERFRRKKRKARR